MDLVQIVSQVGFPIAVATYCLVVLNKTVQQNSDIITKLGEKLDAILENKKEE